MDTYVRPAAPPQDNTFLALGRGLAALNPSVGRFLEVAAADAKPNAEAAATRKLGGMTFEDAQKAMKDGTISELSNPWFKAAFMKQLGQRWALWRQAKNATDYDNSFDKANGNIDEFVAKGAKDDLATYGNDKHFVAGYSQASQGAGDKLRMADAEFKSNKVKDDATQGVYETFMGTYRQLKADGKTPQEIFTALRGNFKGNKDLLHIPYKDQDKELLRAAQTIAEDGDLDTAKAILETAREGEDGTKLGALKDNREYATDAVKILTRAEAKRDEKNKEAGFEARSQFRDSADEGKLDRKKLEEYRAKNPGAISEGAYFALLEKNDTANAAILRAKDKLQAQKNAQDSEDRILDHDLHAGDGGLLPYLEDGKVLTEEGGTKSVSGDKRREAAVKAQMEQEDRKVRRLKSELATAQDPQADAKVSAAGSVAFNRKVDWLSRNGQANPQWESVLRSGFIAASQPTTSGGPVPPALESAVDLYEQLHAKNPRLLKLHVKDKDSMEFYEAVRLSEQYAGMDRSEAYANAIKVTRDPEATASVSYRQRYDDLKTAVSATDGWFDGRDKPRNFTYAQAEIEKLGSFYLKLGLSGDEALREARDAYVSRHTQINGFDVYTGDRRVPPDFSSLATSAIKAYVRDFGGAEGLSEDDVAVASDGTATGAWTLVNRRNGLPLSNPSRRTLTLPAMRDQAAKSAVDAENAEKARKAGDAAEAARVGRKVKGWFKSFFDATEAPFEGDPSLIGNPLP